MPRVHVMDKRMELLAPAGDEAALRAAVCAGADAVYLGLQRFGARASAANFDAEALEKAVAYAHLHHVRVYVAVNTLVRQAELPAAFDALQTIAACRADAAIVQDLGVLRMAREAFPSLALHASTQMGLHSAGGARFAAAHGASRVVLARECTLQTVREVAQTGVAVEVFAHGALCTGVSGQCLLSAMAGGRSGNRGRCAQPCRQAVSLGGTSAALLSMKDLCLRDHLPALWQAGVASLKIEGRLKRAEYVAVVTGSYRKALDALARGDFRPADTEEQNALLQIYQRGGFTKGHLMGDEDAALCATDRVGHGGVAMGRITAVKGGLASASLTLPLHDGDSLRVQGETDVELRYAGHDVQAAAMLRLRPGESVRAGDLLVRTADAAQLAAAQQLAEMPIPIALQATVLAGKPLRLLATDGQTNATATGETVQAALNRPLTAVDIARQLGKLGDTPFALLGDVQVDTDNAYAPLAALNALRRDVLAALAQARQAAFYGEAREQLRLAALATRPQTFDAYEAMQPPLWHGAAAAAPDVASAQGAAQPHMPAPDGGMDATPHDRQPAVAPARATLPQNLVTTLAARYCDPATGQDLAAAGANLLLYAPIDLRPQALAEALAMQPAGAWLALPPQVSDAAYAAIRPLLVAQARRLGGVALGSVGQRGFAVPLPVAFGEGIPIANREAARELLTPDIAFHVLWPELAHDQLAALALADGPSLLPVYGRERVMLLNHCPERVRRGLVAGREACALCKPGDRACAAPDAALADRMGYRFPLLRTRTAEGCVVEVYNALPTDLAKHDARRRQLGAGMLLRFTTETAAEARAITARFARLLQTGNAAAGDGQSTVGRFLRGVE